MPARRRATFAEAEAYARCRSLGHSWDPIPVTKPPRFGVALDLRCVHCATVRRDILQPLSGQVLSRSYSHPDGYRDEEHHSRSDWRAMFVSTLSDALVVRAEAVDRPVLAVVKGRRRA